MKYKVVICVSGQLGFSVFSKIHHHFDVVGILTDHTSEKIISWAQEHQKKIFTKNPRKNADLSSHDYFPAFDFLLSINYLYLIEANLIERPKIMAINIHGALLPKYRGRAPHIWAVINGEKECGITVHKMEVGCDTGDIILQKRLPIGPQTTGGELLKAFDDEYPQMVLEAVGRVLRNENLMKQDETQSSYFGKRTPEDGEIDWTWETARIKNWIRALTKPYPGAFTFIENEKLFIWKVEEVARFDSLREATEPGSATIQDGSIFVKTPNGFLKIMDYSYKSALPESKFWCFKRKVS